MVDFAREQEVPDGDDTHLLDDVVLDPLAAAVSTRFLVLLGVLLMMLME